ncbi:hypothetical protein CCACVL1_17636 [Corchorus capsularis]|uniref:DUF7086 domain-containing protein n=1 Tax=Corchorus capsularis TaxID=210143 RepID=A0A1R3HQQ1_COCAP|nr:hypothetical protein CCACVL1_17636 [Corchorus capsularis]
MENNNPHLYEEEEDNEDLLTLSLSTGPRPQPPSLPPPPPPLDQQQQTLFLQQFLTIPQAPPPPPSPPSFHNYDHAAVSQEITITHSRPPRSRRNPFQAPRPGRTETVPPPFPWATTQRATVQTLDYLLSQNMTKISGEVHCRRCDKVFNIEYDLKTKFTEIASFISNNKFAMHDRAPSDWMNPNLPSCEFCGSCLKPVVTKKRSINWLFLLLGKMLGCCKLSELKYFCKHSKNHRTGAKDRLLYLTYVGLCKQLDPNGPFDV